MSARSDKDISSLVQGGIAAAKNDEFLHALNLLTDAYSATVDPKYVEGLSYLGLCLALVERKYKPAIDLCKKAIEAQFYEGAHYVNLARVYLAAGQRKKAVEIVEDGLKILPEHVGLLRTRQEFGVRSRPAVPFLSRSNALNQAIGRARHARKQPDEGAMDEEE